MKITLRTLEQEKHMEAVNEEGGIIHLDGSRSIGGINGGMSPMQLLLAAAGGCSTIDVMSILKKQKQEPKGILVNIEGDRQSVETWSEFKTIHLHYTLAGDLDRKKVERAIDLSVGKYCSVSKALEKTSEITWSFDIVGELES